MGQKLAFGLIPMDSQVFPLCMYSMYLASSKYTSSAEKTADHMWQLYYILPRVPETHLNCIAVWPQSCHVSVCGNFIQHRSV